MAIGVALTSPTPLDAVMTYEKTQLVPSKYIALNDTSLLLQSTSTGDDLAESFLDKDHAAEETVPAVEESLFNTFSEEPLPVTPTIESDKPYLVPFFSQFSDITSPSWKKVGCGIASLAMLIEFYEPGSVSVDTLLQEGIDANAYLDTAGWTYAGLIGISQNYGLTGKTKDLRDSTMDEAYDTLLQDLQAGPVMASVHYTFVPTNPIPHLVVINGIKDGEVYYNDPAENKGGRSISIEQFKSAWKKRYLVFYPAV